jgi:hypothetical protein
VSDSFDLQAGLAAGVRDAPGAWRFIRRFAAHHASPIVDGDGDGCAEQELLAAEFTDNRELDDATIEVLEKQFHRLPMPDYPFWAVPGPPVRWYEGHGAILRDDARNWLWARTASTGDIAALRRTLPGDWLMDPS